MTRQEFEQKYEHLVYDEDDEEAALELAEQYEQEEERKDNKLCIRCTIVLVASLSLITVISFACQA